jgi:4-amino-4-deoxy-L-arabinose transferase-like glycosyltransferase
VLLLAILALYLPASWIGDIRPAPDAVEYAVTAQRLAQGMSFALSLPGREAPPRYPFGFPALLAPAYWLPSATLQTGFYGVIAFGVAGVLLVYLLGRQLYGRGAGLLAALIFLLLPQSLTWSHAIMSEMATVTLVALAALLLWQASGEATARLRLALLLGAGLVAGLAILVRLTSVVLVVALAVGVVAGIRPRRVWPGALLALGVGPALALVALAAYDRATFGSVTGTGYRHWVPEWYASPGTTFSLAYAFRRPALQGDPAAPPDLPNLAYYARSLTGQLPAHTSLFLTSGFCVLALIGAFALLTDRRSQARALVAFGATLGALTCALSAVYFFPDVRFLAPLAPLSALAVANTGQLGVRLLRQGLRSRRPMLMLLRVGTGAVLIALLLQSTLGALGPALADCYLCQRYVRGNATALARPSPELATLTAYRTVTPPGSLLVTDILPPLLGATGLATARTIVPLNRGIYWGQAPLRDTPSVADRQRIILAALSAGTPVYTDAFSVDPLRASGSGDFERFLATHRARIEVHYADGVSTIYRLVPTP